VSVIGAGGEAAVVGGAAVVGASVIIVVVAFEVVFCFTSLRSAAPAIVLHDTRPVASVRLAAQSVIFFLLPKNAMIFLLSTMRNCRLTPLFPLMTNFCPLLQPSAAILSSSQRSMYSQWEPLMTFLPEGVRALSFIIFFLCPIFLFSFLFMLDFLFFPPFPFFFPFLFLF